MPPQDATAATMNEAKAAIDNPLVEPDLKAGRLVVPFEFKRSSDFAYYLVYPPEAILAKCEAVIDLGMDLQLNSDLVPGSGKVFPKIVGDFYLEFGIGDRDAGILVGFDEIGNAPLAVQEKILRVIEYGELERLGASETLSISVRVIGATVVSALGSTSAAHGFKEQDDKRRQLNEFIRTSGVFDGVADFDKVVTDTQTGAMRAEFVPDNTVGGPGDKLHPNRLGYMAMGGAVDLKLLAPR